MPADPVIGLIPAAGLARRLGDSVPGSKEVVEVGGEPVCAHLRRRLALAGIRQGVVALRHGKWDVPQALFPYRSLGVDLAYVVVDETPSSVHSLAAALPLVGERVVALGFPDILFEPPDAYATLLQRQNDTGADLVLGLFPSDRAASVDMVVLDDEGRPVEIVIKQPDRGLRYSWSIAVWTPVFSDYLLEFVAEIGNGTTDAARQQVPEELFPGDVVQAALGDGMAAEAVIFEQGSYLDVGTPDDLAEARRFIAR